MHGKLLLEHFAVLKPFFACGEIMSQSSQNPLDQTVASPHFFNYSSGPSDVPEPSDGNTLAQLFLAIEIDVALKLSLKQFVYKSGQPVEYVYNPIEYAFDVHSKFVNKFLCGPKKALFLGLNPGPWGMMQTGVPFGEVSIVRDWLQLDGRILQPARQHPARPITGFSCRRSEVSGKRFWALASHLAGGDPHAFFRHSFVYNYFPLVLVTTTGKNVTPADLKRSEQILLEGACDAALCSVLRLLSVETVIAIGRFAEKRAATALCRHDIHNVKVVSISHPSPRNPASNRNWIERTAQLLSDYGLTQYFAIDEALSLAREALSAGEVPVGCVFLRRGEVVARGCNTVNETRNATRHAELNCIDSVLEQCAKSGETFCSVFPEIDVVVTVEPCIMCAAALHNLNVASITYGCANDRFGGCGSVLDTAQLVARPAPVVGGVSANEAMDLLKQFYKGANPNAPPSKAKKKRTSDIG